MNDRKQAEVLLRAAERDVKTLLLIGDAPDLDEVVGFHAQQAAEKLLKAWLAVIGEVYPVTHNLRRLLDALTARGEDTGGFQDLVEYTPFAVRYRYGSTGHELDRRIVTRRVEALLEHVRRLLAEAE